MTSSTISRRLHTRSRCVCVIPGVSSILQPKGCTLLSNIYRKRRALLTEVSGQDGSYLAELLLEKGYEVLGLVPRTQDPNLDNITHLLSDIHIEQVDISDSPSLWNHMKVFRPHEIYNLASMNRTQAGFDHANSGFDVTAHGVMRLLEGIRTSTVMPRFCQLSSSDMFGDVSPPQNEESQCQPRDPYAFANLSGYHVTRIYRHAHGMFASNGVLFNHVSPRREETDVTRRIVKQAVEVKLGLRSFIELEELSATGEWGYANDYMNAVWRIVQRPLADDFVIGTGESHSIKEYLAVVLRRLNLNPERVRIGHSFMNPHETYSLRADAAKARACLGWRPRVTFRDLVILMVETELKRYNAMACVAEPEMMCPKGIS